MGIEVSRPAPKELSCKRIGASHFTAEGNKLRIHSSDLCSDLFSTEYGNSIEV